MAPDKHGVLESATTASMRARELYKYFTPPKSASKQTTPDIILASQAQLIAWRMNCRRSMVSLIDRETQYFVAEAAKTLSLIDRYATLSFELS